MTQDEIIAMAEKCGIPKFENNESQTDNILRFANHVAAAAERNRTWTQSHWTEYERSIAAAEREACAKVCEVHGSMARHAVWMAEECAALIRQRGST